MIVLETTCILPLVYSITVLLLYLSAEQEVEESFIAFIGLRMVIG
jgi:hypothetical protein